ncbi:hypothetical protein ADUPG1_010504, partial [Aduncisulcus paluster]
VDDLSSETLYCKCDAGWYGSTCFTQYPVETVEYVNEDDETNPTIVDYVCGVNYSTDPSSSYSAYGIYSSDTDTYSCDCSSYGLITDASTSTCIDPATHPYYKDIAGNDTACLTCGTTTDSHGTCVLGEGEDSLIAMCQCEYGWGNDVDDSSEPSSSCSIDMCGVSEDTYTESNANPSSLCSSHGVCYSYDSSDSNNASNIQYACTCDDGWNGIMCDDDKNPIKTILCIFIIFSCIFVAFGIFGFTFWLRLKHRTNSTENIVVGNSSDSLDQTTSKIESQDMSAPISSQLTPISEEQKVSQLEDSVVPTVVQVRKDASLRDSQQETPAHESVITVKRRVKKSKLHVDQKAEEKKRGEDILQSSSEVTEKKKRKKRKQKTTKCVGKVLQIQEEIIQTQGIREGEEGESLGSMTLSMLDRDSKSTSSYKKRKKRKKKEKHKIHSK